MSEIDTRNHCAVPRGGRILIAEDDHYFRLILARRLKGAGHEVVVTSDGEEAWARIEAAPPELLITDWMMPRLDGYELCRRIKAVPAYSSIYCVLLTAKDGLEDKVSALDIGADDYLIKPCDNGELLARVRTGLRVRRLCARLEEVSVTDSLTGLRNRRYFDQRLEEEVARARRHFSPLSLVLIDLDGFKAINDGFGHPAGDEVLAQVGAALTGRVRAGDVLARIGGDEFGALLHNTGMEGARSFASDLERILDSLELHERFVGIEIGGSTGCAELGAGLDGAGLVELADRRLYARKRERAAARQPSAT